MIYPKPEFICCDASKIDDLVTSIKYDTVDSILDFFGKIETTLSITMLELKVLLNARKDKSINFVLTYKDYSVFNVYFSENEMDEDYIRCHDPYLKGKKIICHRHNGKEKVYFDIFQIDEYFASTNGNLKGYDVYRKTGVEIVESDLTYNTKNNVQNSKIAVKKFNL